VLVSTTIGTGTSIACISLRRSLENHISPSGKYLPRKYYFSFTHSPTDTHNTGADFKDNC
jgi:hypothetical protein